MYQGELKQPVSRLPGIGPKTSSSLSSAGIITIDDILRHYPRSYENRKKIVPFSAAVRKNTHTAVNTPAFVTGHTWFGYGKKKTLKVIVEDQSGITASLVCFGRNFLADKLPVGSSILLYALMQSRFNELQASSFEFEVLPGEYSVKLAEIIDLALVSESFGRILPVYPLTSGLTQKTLRRTVEHAVKKWAGNIESEIPADIMKTYGILPKAEAVRQIHFPSSKETASAAEYSLKFEELFHYQFSAFKRAYKRKQSRKVLRTPPVNPGELEKKLLENLSFRLTADQRRVLDEIKADISSAEPMSRLLQGDVGSGKTLVAFAAALQSIEAGGQAALMVPTELLARQHADSADRILAPLGIRIALLTGSVKSEKRSLLLRELSAGKIDLIIGTHALFSENVTFSKLSLIIIDEQHRFGVLQRIALSDKNSGADLLLMTATPIPRTLALTIFGDMETSVIRGLPPGRTPVETHLAAIGNEQKVYDFILRELSGGRQVYFVYPLISPSDKSELKDAETMFKRLRDEYFSSFSVGLIHSRLDENSKKQIMDDFRDGRLQILAATSVIEVGVDVPNATCIVIEHAERFGLSALHQLRGRVGRGAEKSYAFLIYSSELTDAGRARLKIMKESSDGFFIAEEDLKIRGPGNVSGREQSGFLPFTIADINTDFDILKKARSAASTLAGEDPGLLQPENSCLRRLLEVCPPFSDNLTGG